MCLANVFCHQFVIALSFIACIMGLWLLRNSQQQTDEDEGTEAVLLRMSFTYWLVYCIAFTCEKILISSEWEGLTMTLKITTALAYFLTFSCILSLPLYKFAVHKVEID